MWLSFNNLSLVPGRLFREQVPIWLSTSNESGSPATHDDAASVGPATETQIGRDDMTSVASAREFVTEAAASFGDDRSPQVQSAANDDNESSVPPAFANEQAYRPMLKGRGILAAVTSLIASYFEKALALEGALSI